MGFALYFDVIILAIVVVLALKGMFSGFVRETCSLLGIVGGVLVASRYSFYAGELLNKILKMNSATLINLFGFMLILALIWIASLIIAELILRFMHFIKLGKFDKYLGVCMAGVKIFLVLSIISFTFSKINFLSNLTAKLQDDSVVYPFMIAVGDFIVKTDFSDAVNVEDGIDELKQKLESTKQSTQGKIRQIKQGAIENLSTLDINQYKPKYENLDEKFKQMADDFSKQENGVVF